MKTTVSNTIHIYRLWKILSQNQIRVEITMVTFPFVLAADKM